MPRIKYYYDSEKCEFEKATLTWKSTLRLGLSYLTVGGILAFGMVSYLNHFHKDDRTLRLEERNRELVSQIASFDDKISNMEEDLEMLHQTDQKVYTTIMNAPPLPEDVWNAGTGGSVKVDELEPEILQETRERLEKINSKLAIQIQSYGNILQKFKEKEEELKHLPSIRPVPGTVISGFGQRLHPILKVRKKHTGLDFQAPIGTPVYATADGVVEFAGVKKNGYGTHLDLQHGYGYVTKYAHLSKILVQPGQRVKRGEVIALTGNTGLSKGPHLHYEILKNGAKIDPIDYFYSDLDPETYIEFKKKASQDNESMD